MYFINVWYLLAFFALLCNSCAQQILLESTIVRCSQDEMLEDGTPKHPLQLASSLKDHPKLDLKLYSKCRKKLLITFRVTEASETFVPNAIVLIDKAKNALTQKSSRFGLPIAVKFHQEALLQKYSLNYLYRVNGKMWEEVINSENNKSFTGCVDSGDGSNEPPSCGYLVGVSPKQVAGFCCTCKDHRNNVQQRGGHRCDTPQKTSKQLTSAHCLRPSPYWYNVYEILPPTLFQKINFEIFNSRESKNGSILWERMSGSPTGVTVDSETQMNAAGAMKVTYRPHVEGISRSATLIDFSKQRLLFPLQNPFSSSDFPDPEPLNGLIEDQVLIVPKSLMSPHGATCDHVGTHIDAFLNQPDACRQERGACLKNQPFDLWKQDQGVHGDPNFKFRLASYQAGHPPLLDFADDYKTGAIYMEHHPEAPTYVDIEIPADNIIILAPGYNAFIESVLTDTGSEGAKIITQVYNKELVEAAFSIELVQCSLNFSQSSDMDMNVEMSSPQKKIGPLNAKHFHLDLHSYAMKLPIYCYVVLVNEFGESVAAREVTLQPFETCLCVHTCKCACGEKTNLQCETMSEESIIATGLISTLKTAEQLQKEEEANHFSQKYRWLFHWILVFHIVLLLIACCGWTHKKCTTPELGKKDLTSASDESISDNMNSSGSSESSEVTLYDRRYSSEIQLLEDKNTFKTPPKTHNRKNKPNNASAKPIQKPDAPRSESLPKGVTFAEHPETKSPSTATSTTTIHSATASSIQTQTIPSTFTTAANTSMRNVSEVASQTATAINTSNQESKTTQKISDHKSLVNPRATSSVGFMPDQAESVHNTHESQGPQAIDSSDWNSNGNDNTIDSFIQYCVSASSSKTSFGTWHRKRRDQYSAYDFLPEPKHKGWFS